MHKSFDIAKLFFNIRSRPFQGARITGLYILLLSMIGLTLSGCGGNSGSAQSGGQISGNWQFTMATPSDNSFAGGLQGGFLLQNNGSITGQVVYSLSLPSTNGGAAVVCNSGTVPLTGTVNGNTVNFSATINTLDQNGNSTTQTLSLSNGELSSGGSAIQSGTYTLTAGYYTNAAGQLASCGTAQSGVPWSAILVPSITGSFQGFFHSLGGAAGLANQDFPLSGSLGQGPNTGASSATVTGTLSFNNPANNINDYQCVTTASVTGQISGNSVILQIYTTNGVDAGQIGGLGNGAGTTYSVTFDNTSGGYVLHNPSGLSAPGYALNTKSCPGSGLNSVTSGDVGNICWAFGGGSGCSQPITFSPVALAFPVQTLGSPATTQTITLNNTTASPQTISLAFADETGNSLFYGTGGDFNGLLTYSVIATGQPGDCTSLAPPGTSFPLVSNCTVTVQFAPQESCPWLLPASSGADLPLPSQCPSNLPASLTINTTDSVDGNSTFVVPVSGSGVSALLPSTPELDFGAEDVGEMSSPQTLTFTNQSAFPIQILSGSNSCATVAQQILPHFTSGSVSGIQVLKTGPGANFPILPALATPNAPAPDTIAYYCDLDSSTNLQPNFAVAAANDSCAGATLPPGGSCSLQVIFEPQPATWHNSGPTGLAYFLELNSVWCDPNTNPSPGPTNPCEIDSGRFPVEFRTNPASSLRMSPAAGFNFGGQAKGTTSNSFSITVTNDQVDQTSVTFTGKSLGNSDYSETDNCPFTLTPGASCTLTFAFTPSIVGFDTSTFTLVYNATSASGTQNGLAQYVYLRGTGQ